MAGMGGLVSRPGRALAVVSIIGVLLVLPAAPASAAIITVDTLDDELNADGDCSLREAIQAANTDAAVDECGAGDGADTINVGAGTYNVTMGLLSVSSAVNIDGAGAASTIIDGGDTSSLFDVFGASPVEIRDLTLQNGLGSGPGGGAIVNYGTLTLDGVVITSSDSGAGIGGGINNQGTLTIQNSSVTDNSTGGIGGGISNHGPLTITNSTIDGNTAPAGAGIHAGDLETVTITNSTISNNDATCCGGGIKSGSPGAFIIIDGSTITGNTADGGAGINLDADGTLTITNSTIENNAADFGGGLFISPEAAATVENTTISANPATGDGGAAHNNGTVTLNSSTVTGNGSSVGGAAIISPGSATLNMGGTVLANSTFSDCNGSVITSTGYNLIEDTTGCTVGGDTTGNITGVDPKLGPLADNGGDTLTHALLTGSPAIDAGSPSCPPPAADQRGVARPQGNACDIGAFERTQLIVTTTDDEFNEDGDCSLREAIEAAFTDSAVDNCGAGSGPDTIIVPAGTYNLTMGTLFIPTIQDVAIAGAGAATTVIDAGGTSGVISIATFGATAAVEISGVTIQNGDTSGAGIRSVYEDAILILTNSVVTGNAAGGIYNGGTLILKGTTVSGNSAVSGAGIFNAFGGGPSLLTNSTVSGNTASSTGGGIWNQATLTLTNTAVSGNTASFTGGGIRNIETLTITGGSVTGNTTNAQGGGILNNGPLTLDGTTISDNILTGTGGGSTGGGISNGNAGSVVLSNGVVSGNTAPGIHNEGVLTVSNTSVSGNTLGTGTCCGGGIENVATATIDGSTISGNGDTGIYSLGPLTVTDTTISDNTATAYGGGISLLGSPGTTDLDGLTITGNTASSGGGGGIANGTSGGSTLTISNTTIAGNTAGSGGGIDNFADGTLTMENSTISGNSATGCCGAGFGGGMAISGDTVLTNSTISGNSATCCGGAIQHFSGTLTLSHSTISGNTAPFPGGGLQSGATVNMGGTILANNTGDCAATIASTGYNLIEDTSGCTITGDTAGNITGLDPVLGPLADNGGPTLTHDLLDGSPAINGGSPDCPPPVTDQRGVGRPIGPRCDIGAVESSSAPPTTISIDDVQVTEGTGETTVAILTVTLSEPSAQPVAVDFATADGTATAPADYRARSGNLSFLPGMVTRQIQVRLVSDALDEPNEDFLVNLSNAVNAIVADGQGVATILDDDEPALPVLTINDASVVEGPTGRTATARFTVTLSQASGDTVTIDWATANGTAVAPGDYKPQPLTTLTFSPGETSKMVLVTVRGDGAVEPNETFFVNLSNATNATIGDGQGLGTILNDD